MEPLDYAALETSPLPLHKSWAWDVLHQRWTKPCTHCKQVLPLRSYCRNAARKEKLNIYCRACIKAKIWGEW